MPTTPAINAIITITVKDINGNSVAKTYNTVKSLHFDYSKGMVSVDDAEQGMFYGSLLTITALTYTIVAGVNGATTVVMS